MIGEEKTQWMQDVDVANLPVATPVKGMVPVLNTQEMKSDSTEPTAPSLPNAEE